MFSLIYRNSYNIINLLIENGVNINQKNKNDESPIIYALRNKNSENIIKLLIDKEADENDQSPLIIY